jgi:hypothetical protein
MAVQAGSKSVPTVIKNELNMVLANEGNLPFDILFGRGARESLANFVRSRFNMMVKNLKEQEKLDCSTPTRFGLSLSIRTAVIWSRRLLSRATVLAVSLFT